MNWRVESFPDMQDYIPRDSILPLKLHQPSHGDRVSFLETSIGNAALHIVMQMRHAASEDDSRRGRHSSRIWEPCIQVLQSTLKLVVEEHLDEEGCEVTYGRAGLLYALLLLRAELLSHTTSDEHLTLVEAVNSVTSDEAIASLVEDIIKRGEIGAKNYADTLSSEESKRAPPLMWGWQGRRYIGAAHGVGKT